MQGKGSTVDSFSETFEFDHGSSSSNSGVDQRHYWNNMLNPGTPNLPNILLSSSDTNITPVNPVGQDGRSLTYWNLGGPGSSEHTVDRAGHDEAKMECGWTSSLITNAATGMRLEERPFEPTNFLSSESVNINLNSNQVANGSLFLQNSNFDDIPQNADLNAGFVGNTGQVTEAGIYPLVYKTDESETEQIPSTGCSSNSCGSASGSVGALGENGDDRPGCLLDRRRLSCKRKSVEGVSGQSSIPGNSRYCKQAEKNVRAVSARNSAGRSLSISSPSDHLSSINSPEEPLNPRPGICMNGVPSDCYPGTSVTGNAESSQRNFRMRINSASHHDSAPPNLLSTGNNIRHSHVWSPHQPSNQTLDSRPVAATSTSTQRQSHILHNPSLPRNVHPFPWNTLSHSRVGSSSSSPAMSGEGAASFLEETNSRSRPRSISDHPIPFPATEIRHLAQNLTNRNLANGNVSIPPNIASTSRTGSSSGVHPALASTSVPHQSPPIHYPRRLSDFVRRSLLPSAGTGSGGQSSNFPPLHSTPSQTMVLPSGARHQGHRQLSQRSAFSMDRHGDGVVGIPLSFQNLAAAGEGRSRLVSEIRNVLDLMRRGENLRLEDVLILDQSGFYGVAELHDRHRDMRLDVDNMSYEELLALEERIGNVSTGLSEDAISKCMKVKMFLPIRIREAPDAEPCCICQEEYIEGEDQGMLDCGHDFHTRCIKQWLMLKNLCPICKTTAFSE